MAQIAMSQSYGVTPLKAAPIVRPLPRLGKGLNLFAPPASAAGNSRLQVEVQGAHISIRV